MYIEHNANKWWISRAPSHFVSRSGKDDVSIYKQSTWGRRQPDGNLYMCCLRYSAENGDLIRYYATVPPQITVEWLKQAGFIDN